MVDNAVALPPWMRPLRTFLNFVREGINILGFSPVYPDFYAYDAGARIIGAGSGEIYISAQRMQWHAALNFFFAAAHLVATQSAGDFNPYAFGAGAHARRRGRFNGAAEGDPALQLMGDILGNQLSLQFSSLNF